MKIFEMNTRYQDGELRDVRNTHIDLCVTQVRKFFDIPISRVIKAQGLKYTVSVFDKKVVNALKVRRNPKDAHRIQLEYGEKWSSPTQNIATERKMIDLFRTSGKKYLYVRLEEA